MNYKGKHGDFKMENWQHDKGVHHCWDRWMSRAPWCSAPWRGWCHVCSVLVLTWPPGRNIRLLRLRATLETGKPVLFEMVEDMEVGKTNCSRQRRLKRHDNQMQCMVLDGNLDGKGKTLCWYNWWNLCLWIGWWYCISVSFLVCRVVWWWCGEHSGSGEIHTQVFRSNRT